MALRDQPYLPLYIQDFLTDEKLIECSAQSTGVYIRLMCVLHKSDEYGKLLLKQKDKQMTEQIKNFSLKLAKAMPFPLEIINDALNELISENVIQIDGDYLVQKRMVKDNSISLARSLSGKGGGLKTQLNNKLFAKANFKANSENENESTLLNNKSVGNFFYIGTELYKMPVSNYVKNELEIKLSDFPKVHPNLKLQSVLDKMDLDYSGYQFTNHNHILKSFDYTAEKLKPKKQYNQPEKITVTSNPKPFPRENR